MSYSLNPSKEVIEGFYRVPIIGIILWGKTRTLDCMPLEKH